MAKYTLLTKEIREAIEKMYDSGVYTFGVRAMTRKPSGERVMVRPGDDVENSYAAYDDVEPRELGGASSVGFSVDFGKVEDEDHFNEIIERVAREYAEDEDQIAIIAGRHNLDDENNDMGETLISSPTVVSVVGDARGILAKKPIGSASESGSALPSLLAPAAAVTGAGMFAAPQIQETYNASQSFAQRRASKSNYWKEMRAEVFGFMNDIANGAFAALDKPLQGYMGLAGVAGTLAAGGTLPQALQQGARIAAQPSEATAYQYGGAMTDALAPYSPQGAAIAGALTNAGIQLTSPL